MWGIQHFCLFCCFDQVELYLLVVKKNYITVFFFWFFRFVLMTFKSLETKRKWSDLKHFFFFCTSHWIWSTSSFMLSLDSHKALGFMQFDFYLCISEGGQWCELDNCCAVLWFSSPFPSPSILILLQCCLFLFPSTHLTTWDLGRKQVVCLPALFVPHLFSGYL